MAGGASLSPYCGVPWRGAAPFAVGFTRPAGQVGVEDGPAQPCPEPDPGPPLSVILRSLSLRTCARGSAQGGCSADATDQEQGGMKWTFGARLEDGHQKRGGELRELPSRSIVI